MVHIFTDNIIMMDYMIRQGEAHSRVLCQEVTVCGSSVTEYYDIQSLAWGPESSCGASQQESFPGSRVDLEAQVLQVIFMARGILTIDPLTTFLVVLCSLF